MDDAPAAAAAAASEAASTSPWPGDASSVSSSSPTSGPRSFVPGLPPGYHFFPTHDELVVHYLRPRLAGQQLQLPIFFDERVLDYHPDRLIGKLDHPSKYGDGRWFFFARRERKHEGGNRPNRATLDNGHWNATGSPRQVRSGGKLVGLVRTLVFYEASRRKKTKMQQSHGEEAGLPPHEDQEGSKAGKGVKTDWTMYEYESFTSEEEFETTCVNGNAKMDVIVLCTIQKKKQKKKEGEATKRKAKEKPRKKRNETPAVDDQVPNNLVANFNVDPNASMSHRFADVSSPPVTTMPPQDTMASVATGDSSQITLHPSTAMHHRYHHSSSMTTSQFQHQAPPPSAQVFLLPNSNSKMIMAAPQGGGGGNNNCSMMTPIRWTMDGSFASDSGTAPPQGLSLQIQSTITNVAAAAPEAHCGGGFGFGFGRDLSNSGYGFAGDGRHLSTTGADFLDVSSFPFPPPQPSYGSSTQEAVVQNEVRANLESFAASMVGSDEWWRRFSAQGSSKQT
ncbi:hypothetical protein HU200_018066 [Digitaria exilis]|uniref:NAC domain-containing protein n=1 Tax=Digitaria exilis TaxID=1010633 RepID=A0A835F5B6_9POAL|nr:hypothetical protein HU200_018066 [Digitaria exilis]